MTHHHVIGRFVHVFNFWLVTVCLFVVLLFIITLVALAVKKGYQDGTLTQKCIDGGQVLKFGAINIAHRKGWQQIAGRRGPLLTGNIACCPLDDACAQNGMNLQQTPQKRFLPKGLRIVLLIILDHFTHSFQVSPINFNRISTLKDEPHKVACIVVPRVFCGKRLNRREFVEFHHLPNIRTGSVRVNRQTKNGWKGRYFVLWFQLIFHFDCLYHPILEFAHHHEGTEDLTNFLASALFRGENCIILRIRHVHIIISGIFFNCSVALSFCCRRLLFVFVFFCGVKGAVASIHERSVGRSDNTDIARLFAGFANCRRTRLLLSCIWNTDPLCT
mmetsp:Transcript_23607/g.42568  ORF Transcript_23607/g.42568 Transcript_23607/m.42568 type:complete len:331 (+) Transcript_23607:1197-2189(+)